jgi:ATP-dependent Zn protease
MADLELAGQAEVRSVSITPSAAAHLAAWHSDQQMAALHEAGHAVVAAILGLPVKSVDLKGRRGAYTQLGGMDDTQPMYRSARRIRAEIAASLAGLIAERQFLHDGTSGSHDDLRRATDLARELVDSGLHPEASWVSLRAFSVREEAVPEAHLGRYFSLVESIIEDTRASTEALVAEHSASVMAFARVVYERRRLSDRDLIEALRSAGVPVADQNNEDV